MGNCCSQNQNGINNQTELEFENLPSKNSMKKIKGFQEIKEKVVDHNPSYGKEIDILPNYLNEFSKETFRKLGEVTFSKVAKDEDADLPFIGPILFPDQSAYDGQWKNGYKHGFGIQVWPDGSKYEGFWEKDVANGQGRLIHPDGDCYIGDWVNNKSHGQGTYIKLNGWKYEGFIFN